VRAYKFLAADGSGVFSRFRWSLPDGGPGAWAESEVDPCRTGIHACRRVDLPYWLAPSLYEIELDGDVEEQALKVVATRGRLLRRIDTWDDEARGAYVQKCIARAAELARDRLEPWAPAPEDFAAGPALAGFMSARIAEELGGVEAHLDERMRQSTWLAERLRLD
jgi:hypothetical protein